MVGYGLEDKGSTMSEMPNSQRISFEAMIIDLSDACPIDGSNPCACPLHEIRSKSQKEKFEWVHVLSDERVLQILAFHKQCKTRFQECFIDGM